MENSARERTRNVLRNKNPWPSFGKESFLLSGVDSSGAFFFLLFVLPHECSSEKLRALNSYMIKLLMSNSDMQKHE
jgi:hypothetical protein